MTPSAEIRLTSVIHGLRDVVLPAIDSSQSLACEQAALILAQLEMLLNQLPWLTRYQALCRDDMRDTALALVTEPRGGPLTLSAAAELKGLLAQPVDDDSRAEYNRVGLGVESLVYALARDGESEYRARVDAAVLAFSRRQVRRERIWFRDAGFDSGRADLPDIPALFTEA